MSDNTDMPPDLAQFFDHSPEAKRRVLGRKYFLRGIPAKDLERLVGLDELRETDAMVTAREWLSSPDPMLVLAGGLGTGKTTAAAWAVSQDPPDEYGWPRSGLVWPADLGPRFLDAQALARVNRYDPEQIGPLEKCALLTIDDLGTEFFDSQGAFHTTLTCVVNARYSHSLRTVITTNLGASEFTERYGARIADRIREAGWFVELAGESMRADIQPGGGE